MFNQGNKKIFFFLQFISLFIALFSVALSPKKSFAVTLSDPITKDVFPITINDNTGSRLITWQSGSWDNGYNIAIISSSTDGLSNVSFGGFRPTPESQYIDFIFATNTIPLGASIDKISLNYNYFASNAVKFFHPYANLEFLNNDSHNPSDNVGLNFKLTTYDNSLYCYIDISCEVQYTQDITNLIQDKTLNSFKLRVTGYEPKDNNFDLSSDYLALSVTYRTDVVPSVLTSLGVTADKTSLSVASTTNLIFTGYDQNGSVMTGDSTTTIHLSSDFGSVGTSTLTLSSGIATTTASSSATGTITFFATTTSVGGDISTSTTVEFTPVPAPLVSDQDVYVSIDNSIPITLSATDTNNLPLNYSFVSTSTISNGSIGDIFGNQVTYIPSGLIGNDSFTFKANNGYTDSATGTIRIHITPGYVSSLKLITDSASTTTASSTTLTITGYDKKGNILDNSTTTTIHLSSDFGSVGTSTLTLSSGIATTTASSSATGTITFFATTTSVGGDISTSTTVEFFEPVVIVNSTTTDTFSSSTNITTSTTTPVVEQVVRRGGGGIPQINAQPIPVVQNNPITETQPVQTTNEVAGTNETTPVVEEIPAQTVPIENPVNVNQPTQTTPTVPNEIFATPTEINPLPALAINSSPFFNAKTGTVAAGAVVILGGGVYSVRMFRRRKNLIP